MCWEWKEKVGMGRIKIYCIGVWDCQRINKSLQKEKKLQSLTDLGQNG